MNDKELFQKLNSFKSIIPDNEWKNSCREILLSQISRGQTVEELNQKKQFGWKIFFGDLLPQRIRLEIARPVWAGVFVMILLITGGVVGVYASRNANPEDSLYIAKIISEKAQFAITFDEKEKTRLNLEFAINRAKEINKLLEKTTVNEAWLDKNEKVQKLTANFKKEISQAKNRLNKTNINSNDKEEKEEEESRFFGANLSKDNQRIEISEPVKVNNSKSVISEPKPVVETVATTTAVSTVENLAKDNSQTASEILDEAEKLFDEEKYSESIDKLKKVN